MAWCTFRRLDREPAWQSQCRVRQCQRVQPEPQLQQARQSVESELSVPRRQLVSSYMSTLGSVRTISLPSTEHIANGYERFRKAGKILMVQELQLPGYFEKQLYHVQAHACF